MLDNSGWRVIQQQQRALQEELNDSRLRRESGVPDRVPGVLKVLGVLVVLVPFIVILARATGVL